MVEKKQFIEGFGNPVMASRLLQTGHSNVAECACAAPGTDVGDIDSRTSTSGPGVLSIYVVTVLTD